MKDIINIIIKDFPTLIKDEEFAEIIFNIIKNNYAELEKAKIIN